MNSLPCLIAASLAAMALSGCSSLDLNESARSSSSSPVGSLSVLAFDYLPAKSGEVSPQNAQTKPTSWRRPANGRALDQDVGAYVRDAVTRKLSSDGIKIGNPDRKISGDIEEFSFKGTGADKTDCVLRIKYRITTNDTVAYEATKDVGRTKSGFFDPRTALDDLVDLSVHELLQDPAFREAIKSPNPTVPAT
ncbi:MAG TPA: hypothetical protein VG734_13810 [Lacunisphaera sp.]|nr:hypothetical protein [Lacunisphaera sp.]